MKSGFNAPLHLYISARMLLISPIPEVKFLEKTIACLVR